MIRKGTCDDIDKILKITKACAAHMIAKNIFQWNAFYPNKTAFENDINRGEWYILETNSSIIGCITMSTLMDKEYTPISWLTPNKNNIYVHRLDIHPVHQGQ